MKLCVKSRSAARDYADAFKKYLNTPRGLWLIFTGLGAVFGYAFKCVCVFIRDALKWL